MNNNNHRRRSFRPKQYKSGGSFRRRNGVSSNNQNGHFKSNGNVGFSRNGSSSNPYTIEKTIQKFQQLAKDAQSSGDPVLVENYLQHADHYSRRLSELSSKHTQPEKIIKNLNISKEGESASKVSEESDREGESASKVSEESNREEKIDIKD